MSIEPMGVEEAAETNAQSLWRQWQDADNNFDWDRITQKGFYYAKRLELDKAELRDDFKGKLSALAELAVEVKKERDELHEGLRSALKTLALHKGMSEGCQREVDEMCEFCDTVALLRHLVSLAPLPLEN